MSAGRREWSMRDWLRYGGFAIALVICWRLGAAASKSADCGADADVITTSNLFHASKNQDRKYTSKGHSKGISLDARKALR